MSEERSESSDAGLAAAFETATKDNYLGNPACIDSLLRVMLAEALDLRGMVHRHELSEEEFTAKAGAVLRRTADILLGRDSNTVPIGGWNQPGGVDEHLAKELNLPDASAEGRVVRTLCLLTEEICSLVAQEERGEPLENTRWQMHAAVEMTCKMLLGIPLPGDAAKDGAEQNDDQ